MPTESLFIKCRHCGKGMAKDIYICGHCSTKRKRFSIIHWAGIVFFCLIFWGIVTTQPNNQAPPNSPSAIASSTSNATDVEEAVLNYSEEETVNVGYMSYAVWRSQWATRLGDNEFLYEAPDAMYLVVELTVRNNDSEPRMIPNFELVDEAGAIYETSSKAWAVDNAIGVLDSLNPNVDKTGIVVFDVPQKNGYKLKASGGFWSSEDTTIELSPNR